MSGKIKNKTIYGITMGSLVINVPIVSIKILFLAILLLKKS
jgi:hypothetical protein